MSHKAVLVLLVLALLIPRALVEAAPDAFSDFFHTNATTNQPGKSVRVTGYGTLGIRITGNLGGGTATFTGSVNGIDTFLPILCRAYGATTDLTEATQVGNYKCDVGGLASVQVPLTGMTGGNVTIQGTATVARSGMGGGAGGGGAGTVTSVTASGGIETTSGLPITGSGTVRGTVCSRAVTGTSDTIVSGDRGCIVTYNNANPVAVTLPQAGTGAFIAGFHFTPINIGAGTVTITPTSSTINTAANLAITQNKGAMIASDGSNYYYDGGLGGAGGSGTVTSVDASGGVETVSGSAITGSGTIRGMACKRAVTGTTDTILTTDRGCFVVYNNAAPVAVTIPQAGTTGFENKFFFVVVNIGAGLVTLDPTTSTINAAPDLDVPQNGGAVIMSDGTNYFYNGGLGLGTETQGLDDVIAIDRTYGGAVSQSTAVRIGNAAATEYWLLFRDATLGLMLEPEVNGVLGDANKHIKIYTNHTFDFLNNSNSSIGKLTESTGAWTNMKLDAEGSNNSITIKKYKYFDFVACQAGVATVIMDLPSSNAPTGVCKGSTYVKGVLEFPDGATDLSALIKWYLNEDWLGAIDATMIWESASTSTNNVLWGIAIACAGPGDNSDPSFTDDDFSADANNGTANTYNATAANTVTTTGTCTAGDMMHIRIKRRLSQAGDTLAATAQGIGLSLKLRETQ